MPATTKGAWKLQEVRDALLANEWVSYNTSCDPGNLYTWGVNSIGQLGINSMAIGCACTPCQVPGNSWTRISVGCAGFLLAKKCDNTLWSWGNNAQGELGINSNANSRSSPIQIPGTNWQCVNGPVATKTDGTLWSWGTNYFGEIGDNAVIQRSSPVQIPGTSWSTFERGNRFTGALKTDGTLWMWGANYCGRLGDGGTVQRSSPVQIPGTNWVEVSLAKNLQSSASTGYAASFGHTLARKTDGTLWAWGANWEGVLGLNLNGNSASTARSSPVQIPGTNWSQISAGLCHNLALKSDGTAWAWGFNSARELGLGASFTYGASSPVQIPGSSWIDISANGANSMGRTSS